MELFRDGNYRRLWLAGGFVGVIRWLELLAVSVFVYEVTGSAFQTALMTFFRFLPMVLLGAVFGAIADRYNRKALLIWSMASLAAVTLGLGLLAHSGTIAIWHVALGIFLGGAVHTSEFPVRRTMLGEIAGPDRVQPALALDSVTNNATRLLGPVMGGVLYDQVGLHGAYFLCAALYAWGALLSVRVAYTASYQPTSKTGYIFNLLEGLRYVRSNRMLVGALLVTVLVNMFAVPVSAMIPVIGKEVLSASASMIGVLQSTEGIGAMIGSLLIAWLQPANFPRTYLIGSFLYLLGVLLFAGVDGFLLAVAILFATGIGHAGFSTTQSAIIFTSASPEMRSRMFGVLATSIGAGPLGVIQVWLLAEWLGAPLAVAIMAAEGLVLLTIVALRWPELFRGVTALSTGTAAR